MIESDEVEAQSADVLSLQALPSSQYLGYDNPVFSCSSCITSCCF